MLTLVIQGLWITPQYSFIFVSNMHANAIAILNTLQCYSLMFRAITGG